MGSPNVPRSLYLQNVRTKPDSLSFPGNTEYKSQPRDLFELRYQLGPWKSNLHRKNGTSSALQSAAVICCITFMLLRCRPCGLQEKELAFPGWQWSFSARGDLPSPMQNPDTALHPAEPSLFLWVEFALARLEGKTKPRKLIRTLYDRGTTEKNKPLSIVRLQFCRKH